MLYLLGLLLCVSWLEACNTITVIGIGRLGLCTALCFEFDSTQS